MKESNVFKVLSDEIRRNILELLREKKRTAGELAQLLNITPARLSYHLDLLKSADLVLYYKEKNFIFYELNTSIFEELIIWLKRIGDVNYEKKN